MNKVLFNIFEAILALNYPIYDDYIFWNHNEAVCNIFIAE